MNDISVLDLTTRPWKLACFRPNGWRLRPSVERPNIHRPELTVDAIVPGSAHTALRAAKIIEDWNVGTKSRDCEWLEHRHWEFYTAIDAIAPGTKLTLEAEGLDHSGWILVDTSIVAEFEGSLLRHRFELSEKLADGKPHRLSIIFDQPPMEHGQLGFTSRTKYFKPRFSYSWDWVPHIVPVGIWDSIRLVSGEIAGNVVRVQTSLNDDHESARMNIVVNSKAAANVHIKLGEQEWDRKVDPGEQTIQIDLPKVKLWWPNGAGPQNVYPISIAIDGQERFNSTVGFKAMRWLPCEGAKPDAAPWICEINGKQIFLQGVNWTPVSPDYAAVTRDDYAKLIDLYKQMGVNLVRVWGGAFLEKEDFYDLCDRAGILVWQEFPLSSSGCDNAAPTDPPVIEKLCAIATDYVHRRGHHACKLLWCGGNELSGSAEKGGPPNDLSHPALAALKQVVDREDPGARFIPTSPSGPSFSFDVKRRGQGVHEDTHGPWNWGGDMQSWREHWQADDSLFHSEFGFPGCSSLEILNRYRGDCALWPPSEENPYWMHSAAWWIQWDRFKDQVKDLKAEEAIARFVELSQSLQAEALTAAAATIKKRFPKCGGMIIWMGHDCFPCPSNTSIIEFQARAKPAFEALTKVFAAAAG